MSHLTFSSRRILTDYGVYQRSWNSYLLNLKYRFRGTPSPQGLPIDSEITRLEREVWILTHFQGYTEVRYDEERKRVVYEPLQLTQAFR
jgi:hypothetical protein